MDTSEYNCVEVPAHRLQENQRRGRKIRLSRFACTGLLTFIFSLIGIIQGAYFTYFTGIMSTLEKRYAFDTKITGLILIADNLSHVFFSIPVGYYARNAHKPKVITLGMMSAVLSTFLASAPYFVYGARLKPSMYGEVHNETFSPPLLCGENFRNNSETCDGGELSMSYCAVSLLFMANFFNGIGSIAYYTVGTTYLDDIAEKKTSPLFLGLAFSFRLVGPTCGFMLAGFCLKLYEDPYADPGFTSTDPEWIGAWWIGFLVLGAALFFTSLLLLCFPNSTNHKKVQKPQKRFEIKKTIENLFISVKKLGTNRILLFHTLSLTMQINGIFGYFTFMPKYMESQYRQTASRASLFSGAAGIITIFVGILLGGCVINFLKPRPRYLTGYMVFVELFAVFGLLSAIFLGCETTHLFGLDKRDVISRQDCEASCGCSEQRFEPVCVAEKDVYYSPCSAGCHDYSLENNTVVFHNCSCIQHSFSSMYTYNTVKQGLCQFDCSTFVTYFAILTTSKVLANTAKVGNILITLRSVPEKDKALALGTVESVISVLATIPYPLIYGAVIDSTCMIWEENCSGQGNCRLYDNEKFRTYFHSLSISFLVCAAVFEFFVFYFSKDMKNFYGDDETHQNDDEDADKVTVPMT